MATKVQTPDLHDINEGTLAQILAYLTDAISLFSRYVTTLTPDDRTRLQSVSLKREGFVQAVELLWKDNPQFKPSYIDTNTINDLNNDYDRYTRIITAAGEVLKMAQDAKIDLTSLLYKHSLAFYENVKRAANDRIPEALPVYEQLKPFFESHTGRKADNTVSKKQLLKDAKAIIDGTKEGKIVLENHSPEVLEGKRTIVDETQRKTDIRLTEKLDEAID